MHGEPSLDRSLRCVFTLAENVIGISVEQLSNSDIVKRNLAYASIGNLLRLTANLRYGHHPLVARMGYPPAAAMGGQQQEQPQNFSIPVLDICLELESQGWVNIEMEVKPLNLPSLRNRQRHVTCPGEVNNDMLPSLAVKHRRRHSKCPLR